MQFFIGPLEPSPPAHPAGRSDPGVGLGLSISCRRGPLCQTRRTGALPRFSGKDDTGRLTLTVRGRAR